MRAAPTGALDLIASGTAKRNAPDAPNGSALFTQRRAAPAAALESPSPPAQLARRRTRSSRRRRRAVVTLDEAEDLRRTNVRGDPVAAGRAAILAHVRNSDERRRPGGGDDARAAVAVADGARRRLFTQDDSVVVEGEVIEAEAAAPALPFHCAVRRLERAVRRRRVRILEPEARDGRRRPPRKRCACDRERDRADGRTAEIERRRERQNGDVVDARGLVRSVETGMNAKRRDRTLLLGRIARLKVRDPGE